MGCAAYRVPSPRGKFKYSHVSRDIKSRELGDALELLEMAGLVYKVYHTGSNGIPLKAESDTKRFKVLFFDVGLAQRLLKLDHRPLLLNPDISRVNKGAIAELFTGLEFIAYQDFREKAGLYYWHREAKSHGVYCIRVFVVFCGFLIFLINLCKNMFSDGNEDD
jgi:predicted AAA+ superfamily ATPase